MQAQGNATASRSLEISVFGGPAGVFTGLDGGHNLSLTVGADVGFRPFYGFLPAVEVRGLYAVDDGTVVAQKNILGGLRLEKRRRGLRLYGDVVFGRGSLHYLNGGYLDQAGDYLYTSNTTNVVSPGAGVSVDLVRNFSLFADAQFQHYATPVTVSGSLWSKPVTIGVIYRLPFDRHGRPYP